ncbi:hypothetical protein AB0B89_20015 [Sphaerisporangium sp. NPDC049002]
MTLETFAPAALPVVLPVSAVAAAVPPYKPTATVRVNAMLVRKATCAP